MLVFANDERLVLLILLFSSQDELRIVVPRSGECGVKLRRPISPASVQPRFSENGICCPQKKSGSQYTSSIENPISSFEQLTKYLVFIQIGKEDKQHTDPSHPSPNTETVAESNSGLSLLESECSSRYYEPRFCEKKAATPLE